LLFIPAALFQAMTARGNSQTRSKPRPRDLVIKDGAICRGRVATLKAEIGKQATAGIMGKRKYSARQGDFVLA
jgi:hypothetical protein